MQQPLISYIQKIVIYETKARFYVVGSNNVESRFRVLKVDRTEAKELNITDDKVEYTRKEIRELLLMIEQGNQTKMVQKANTKGLHRTVSAFGIVGFIRFLEGYYIVLITKRRRVAMIGCHTLFKIEDTRMVYIPNDTVRYTHPDEQRYVKMFQNIDLSSNFYFSYSYDLTRTLQYNMAPCQGLTESFGAQADSQKSRFWTSKAQGPFLPRSKDIDGPDEQEAVEDAGISVTSDLFSGDDDCASGSSSERENSPTKSSGLPEDKDEVHGYRTPPAWKYAWNEHLLKPAVSDLHSDWLLIIIHGFIGQSALVVFGRTISMALVARRSNQFAGTRFLKRGSNAEGHVANEVETEQIVIDLTLSLLDKARFTSFVQMRGSIPLHWSQDVAKMVPKPSIIIDQASPYGSVAGKHFNQVLSRYGSPVIILNLIKKREKKPRESILRQEFMAVLEYLNQFLPDQHAITYMGLDMARASKSKKSDVLQRLATIAETCVKKTGFFHSKPGYYCNKLRPNARCQGLSAVSEECISRQHGIVRTNCVDCLDRTNTAQFAIGKSALGFQLHALGILDSPSLEFDTDCVRMLEDLYEGQGDTLALQYGGSQLVHRIKSYRNVAPWTSSSRDIMMTLSRYYSNAFSDADKQHALNLFLGVYMPQKGLPNIWELPTDFYLHNPVCIHGPNAKKPSYSQWWDSQVYESLPYPYEEASKGVNGMTKLLCLSPDDERVNQFWELYRPFDLSRLEDLFLFHIPNSIRDFMPKYASSLSPFALRVHPGRRQEEYGTSQQHAPSMSGVDSTSSVTSVGSESGSSSSSDSSDVDGELEAGDEGGAVNKDDTSAGYVSLKDLFPTMKMTYGVELKEPNKHSIALYKRHALVGNKATCPIEESLSTKASLTEASLICRSTFPLDSSQHVEPPTVKIKSREIYAKHVHCGKEGPEPVPESQLEFYRKYVRKAFQ